MNLYPAIRLHPEPARRYPKGHIFNGAPHAMHMIFRFPVNWGRLVILLMRRSAMQRIIQMIFILDFIRSSVSWRKTGYLIF